MNKLLLILIVSMFLIGSASASWTNGLNTGITSYFRLNETSGTFYRDEISANSTKVNMTNAHLSDGLIGYAFGPSTTSTAGSTNITTGVATVNLWMRKEGALNSAYHLTSGDTSTWTDGSWGVVGTAGNNWDIYYNMGGGAIKLLSQPVGTGWHMLTFAMNSTTLRFYFDGTYVAQNVGTRPTNNALPLCIGDCIGATTGSNAGYDELGTWSRILTETEITTLYNGGTGITYVSEPIEVSINSPSNNSVYIVGETINFNTTANNFVNDIKNATLYINNTFIANQSFFNLIWVPIPNATWNYPYSINSTGNHTWYVKYCDNSSSCLSSNVNNVIIDNLRINSATYNSSAVAGSVQTFILNVTSTGLSLANFTYNGVIYIPNILTTGSESIISYSLAIPTGASSRTFNWTLRATSGNTYQSANYVQTISGLNFDNCSLYTNRVLNMSLLDERLQTFLTIGANTTIEVTLLIFPTNQYENLNYLIANISKSFNSNNGSICVNGSLNSSYYMDAQIRYFDSNYAVEQYNIKRYLLNNATVYQNINLYDLASSESTEFLITFKDDNYLPVPNALIEITRKYVGEGVFKTVEIPITDSSGQAKGHFNLDSIYTINVIKNGVILATYNNIIVSCQNPLLQDCKLNLNQPATVPSFDIINPSSPSGNLNYLMSFNATTKVITLTYSTANGQTAFTVLNATLLDRFGNTTVCQDTLTSSAGTLTCTIPSTYGNSTVIAKFYSNGNLITTQVYTMGSDPRTYFGSDWIFILIMFCTTIPLLFMPDPVLLLVGCVISFVVSFGLLLLMGGSLIGTGSFLVYFIIVVGLMTWKISKIRNG